MAFVNDHARKFARLILHRGKREGRQILPWNNIKEFFIRARGRGAQHLYMVPSLDLLVIQFADTDSFDDASFLAGS